MPVLPPPAPGAATLGNYQPSILTLGNLKQKITRYHKENENDDLLNDVANDAIESLWRSILLVSLSQFMSGPITNLTIAAGAERATIVSVADPLVAPVPAQVAGGAIANARTYDVAYTLVTESGSETLLSPSATLPVAPNFLLSVPAPAFVAASMPGIIGWNCYACFSDGRMALQNEQVLDFSATYREPEDVGITDSPDLPSAPATNTTADNVFYVRVLQVQNNDGTWTTWQAGDLDGLLFNRANRSIASSSSYQGYAYDVLNGNTIEVRPAAGTTLAPRYFFVVKPRRLRFNNAIVPFQNLATEEFLKMYAGGLLDLSNHEYTGYGLKMKHAEARRLEILQGLNTQATTKQKAITPYLGW